MRFASSALPACAGSGFFLPDHGRAARGRADAGRTAGVLMSNCGITAEKGRCVGGGDGVKSAEECATDVRPVPGEPLGKNTCGVADRRRVEVTGILLGTFRLNVSARTQKKDIALSLKPSSKVRRTLCFVLSLVFPPWEHFREKVRSASTLRKHAHAMCRARSKHRHRGGLCAGGLCATRWWVCVQCRLSVRRCPMPLLPLSIGAPACACRGACARRPPPPRAAGPVCGSHVQR